MLAKAVPSDCVVGSVALNCGPFGSVLAYTSKYPLKVVPLCAMMSASKFVLYHNVPSAGSSVGAFNDAVYEAVQLYKYNHDSKVLSDSLLGLEFPQKSIDILLDGGYFDELEVHEMDEIFVEVIHPSWDVPEPANDE